MNDLLLTKSEKKIISILFKRGAQSQATLAGLIDLKQQSVSRLLNGLKSDGYLVDGPKVPSGKRGYPSATFDLNPSKLNSVGLAIMSDSVALAIVDFKGTVLAEAHHYLPSMSKKDVLAWAENQIESIKRSEILTSSMIAGVGISISASYIGEGHGFNTPYYLNEWNDIDIPALFENHFNLPAWVDNDGNAAALGESMLGVGRWANSFAYIYISSGLGGGVVLNGEVWRGKYGNAGEFAGGLPSNIFPFPNLELLRLTLLQRGIGFDSVNDLICNFDPSWSAIDEWITKIRDSLSIIVSNASAILDIDAVVLGGRIPKELAEKVIPFVEFYDQKRRDLKRPVAKLVCAESTGNAAAIGAAMLPISNSFFEPL